MNDCLLNAICLAYKLFLGMASRVRGKYPEGHQLSKGWRQGSKEDSLQGLFAGADRGYKPEQSSKIPDHP